MKKIILPLLPVFALAACGEEPAPAPEPVETAAPEPVEPALPAPNQEIFSSIFAASCPNAKSVNTAVCRRAGMGSDDVICEYGLGEDEYLRNKATLVHGDGEWVLTDIETVCATGA